MTTERSSKTRIYCVRCGERVIGPVRGALGLLGHTGHLDPASDRTCGPWAYREERASDREEGEAMTNNDLVREYLEMRRAEFDRMFGHNAERRRREIARELLARGITQIPNLFGPIQVEG